MWQRNQGRSEEDILQNQFTAYVSTAVQRMRKRYIWQLLQRRNAEQLAEDVLSEFLPGELRQTEQDMLRGLPLDMQMENDALFLALKALSQRERHIFLARVLDQKEFEELGQELGLSYKGAAAVYYRALQKIRKKMKEMRL